MVIVNKDKQIEELKSNNINQNKRKAKKKKWNQR